MDLRRTIRPAALAAMVCALVACAEPRTELVVVIHSDIEELERVVVDIGIPDRTVPLQSVPVAVDGLESFPLTFGITSRSHTDALVDIEVTGTRGAAEVVFAHARTRFVPRESRVLVIVLERACASRGRCAGERLTCRSGECVDVYIPPSQLPHRADVLPDAGVQQRLDAGSRGDGGDAGIDGGPGCTGDAGVTGVPTGCVLERWPARPTCGDTGDDGAVHYLAILDPIVEAIGGSWAHTGFDLDGICTDPGLGETLTECGVDGGRPILDGRNGIDNSAGDTLALGLDFVFPDYGVAMRDTLREGRNVPILRISGWSGEPDDATVAIWLAGTVDVLRAEDLPADGGVIDPEAPRADPRWDGTDRAYLSSTYFSTTDDPIIADYEAYVAGGVLVAQLPDRAPIDLPVPNRGIGRLRFTDTRLVARLAPDGRSLTEIVVAGRWAEADMFAYTDDLGICPSDPRVADFLPAFRAAVQRSLDVRSLPGSGGAGIPCNAVSTMFPFETAVPIELGGVVDYTVTPPGCP